MPEYKNNGAVWVKRDKNGNQYLAFKADRDIAEGEWLNLFKVKNRKSDKAPHYSSFEVIEDDQVEDIEVGDLEDIDMGEEVDPSKPPF